MITLPSRLIAGAVTVGALFLTAANVCIGGTVEDAGKTVAQSQAKEPFPIHFSLTAGIDKEFVFRGVNILPEQNLDLVKASDIAINSLPAFKSLLQAAGFPTTQDFVSLLGFPRRIRVARESGIGYFDGDISYTRGNDSITAGAFYALQDRRRIEPGYLGGTSFFTEYREFDAFLTYSHSFGPVSLTLGGTYYHVEKNSDFDTAELNFGVSYTPPQFHYVSFSFSYNYASGYNTPGDYLDGHDLEFRVTGTVPVYKKVVSFNPYMLVSMGSGIVPRAFNRLTLPTYFSNKLYAQALTPVYNAIFNNVVSGGNGGIGGAAAALAGVGSADASSVAIGLDRDFDLSNFQVGFRVPVYLTRYVTLTGNANYSRPLGNLAADPYNQKDVIWGGVNINFTY